MESDQDNNSAIGIVAYRESLRQAVRWGAGSWDQEQFYNAEEEEHPPLEAATKQRNVDCEWEHEFVCDSNLLIIVASSTRVQ
jgi:hypothetical protein